MYDYNLIKENKKIFKSKSLAANPLNYDEKVELLKSDRLSPEEVDLLIKDNRVYIVYLILNHEYCTENTLIRNINAFSIDNVRKFGSVLINNKRVSFKDIRKILLEHSGFTKRVLDSLAKVEKYANHDLMTHALSDFSLMGQFACSYLEQSRIYSNDERLLDTALSILEKIEDQEYRQNALKLLREGSIRAAFRDDRLSEGYVSLSKTIKDILIKNFDYTHQTILANLPQIEERYLEDLSKSENKHVRRCISDRSDLSISIINLLIIDPEEIVRSHLAINKTIDLDLLKSLFEDESIEVKRWLLMRGDLPQEERDYLRKRVNIQNKILGDQRKNIKKERQLNFKKSMADMFQNFSTRKKLLEMRSISYKYTLILDEALEELNFDEKMYILLIVLDDWILLRRDYVKDFLIKAPKGFLRALEGDTELHKKWKRFEGYSHK